MKTTRKAPSGACGLHPRMKASGACTRCGKALCARCAAKGKSGRCDTCVDDRARMRTGGFCASCSVGSEFVESGPVEYFEFDGPMRFLGQSDPCRKCGSVVRTLFFCLGPLPLAARGSFRTVETPGEASVKVTLGRHARIEKARRFHVRSVPLRRDHVLKARLGALAILAFVGLLVAAFFVIQRYRLIA